MSLFVRTENTRTRAKATEGQPREERRRTVQNAQNSGERTSRFGFVTIGPEKSLKNYYPFYLQPGYKSFNWRMNEVYLAQPVTLYCSDADRTFLFEDGKRLLTSDEAYCPQGILSAT